MAAEAAVSFAVETLGNLLIQKAVFLKGVARDVEWVRKELQRMQCFLKDAATKQSDNPKIRNWISEIREVAHDAEDAIEIYVLKVESRGPLERRACFPRHLNHLYKIGKEIESIRQRLGDIERSRLTYDIQDLGGPSRTRSQLQVESRRRLPYWQQDRDVVGLEKDVRLLLDGAILQERRGLSVTSIVGMGGIGKSTLARKIYHHTEIASRFDCRVWVVVSSEFTVEDIMKQILVQLGISLDRLKLLESVDDKLRRQQNLQEELCRHLNGKRYFIVLDDVWEAAHWESLRASFPDVEDKDSRLFLTSRNEVMREYSQFVHYMKVLDANHSWELFLKKAFTDGKCPEELQNIGEEILKWCGGLPLAISVVGGLLQRKTPCQTEWEKVLKELKSHLRRNQDIDSISAILELSYENLPPELKACFLCLGSFEEDAIIKVKTLVHIWVAHGLVVQEQVGEEETMEDVAKDYLSQLISRNVIQVKRSLLDQVKACHVHDLLHQLSRRKAKEEIKLEVFIGEEGDSHHSLHKPRHRTIHRTTCYSWSRSFSYTNQNQYLRSLFTQGGGRSINFYGIPSSYWKSFQLLRILNFGDARLSILPEALGRLTGLRYIRMNFRALKLLQLPLTWAKLVNLQVLVLARGPLVIDEVILKMDSLRHLYANIHSCEVPLGKMRNLQTLRWFPLEDSSVWKIQGMVGVSELGFRITKVLSDASISKLFEILAEMGNLVCLRLIFHTEVNIYGLSALQCITELKLKYYRCRRLPTSFPPNLSHLTLDCDSTTNDKDPMPKLERLPELVYLKLRDAYDGTLMVISRHGFPRLKILHLQLMIVRCILVEKGGLPVLQQFFIRDCPDLNLANLPQHMKSAITDE